MKQFTIIALIAVLCAPLFAEVGWCGEIWPNSGSERPTGDPITVYFQIWKGGTTDSPGRGEGIAATLYWRESGAAVWETVELDYNTDVGNNDEYFGDIPAPVAEGVIEYYCEALDSTDMVASTGTDQNGVALNLLDPGILNIVDAIEIDVTVTFQVDMSLEIVSDVVTLSGSFNGWNTYADTMTDLDSDGIFTIDIVFPAGSSPSHEYKYVKDGVYEYTSNRILTVDDSSPTQILPVVFFEDRDPADYTDIDIDVHFRVNMSAEIVTTPYVAGNVFPLVWGWDAGWNDALILYDDGAHDDVAAGDGIYGAILTFPAGSWRYIEYKFTTDGTDNEPLPPFENHTFELGDVSPQVLPIDVFGSLENVSEVVLPKGFSVKVSPNPFNSAVEIAVQALRTGNLELSVFGIDGRLVKIIYSGNITEGNNIFRWDAVNENSGLYFIKIENNGISHTEKILLVK